MGGFRVEFAAAAFGVSAAVYKNKSGNLTRSNT